MHVTGYSATASLAKCTDAELVAMAAAGDDVLRCLGAIGRAATNPVAQILKTSASFIEDDHYPDGDVFDASTASQYYYHAHRADTGEHGHFHTFIRAGGIPSDVLPAPYTGSSPVPSGADAICHLVAVSMNSDGLPTGLFTTNRWVTDETFYAAADTILLLPSFGVDHVYPCWATNRWLTATLRLFSPTIADLIRARDATIADWQRRYPDRDCYEDRELEVTSEFAIDIDDQIAAVDVEIARRGIMTG